MELLYLVNEESTIMVGENAFEFSVAADMYTTTLCCWALTKKPAYFPGSILQAIPCFSTLEFQFVKIVIANEGREKLDVLSP